MKYWLRLPQTDETNLLGDGLKQRARFGSYDKRERERALLAFSNSYGAIRRTKLRIREEHGG
jgi:hypothetical protein